MMPIKTILHPTDFSESSRFALDIACGMAADYRAQLVILHVITSPLLLLDGAILVYPEGGMNGVKANLSRLDIPNDRIDVVRRVEEGSPAREILGVAELCHADLIVMGSHGRTGLGRWILGSVAELVTRQATCPVLTLKHPGPQSRPDKRR